jgi:hypothetical protein
MTEGVDPEQYRTALSVLERIVANLEGEDALRESGTA